MSIDLTTVFQAMPYAQNVAHAELVHPEIHLAVSQVLAQQALAEQNKQTPRIEKQDAMGTVQDKGQRQAPGQRRPLPRRHPPAESEETQSANPTPFAGHILDMKV